MLHIEAVRPGPDEDVLYQELFAGLPVPMPPPGDNPSRWNEPAGVLAARDNGALRAWAVYFAEQPSSPRAVLQWIVVERERQRITAGYNTEHPGTAEEIGTLAALAAEAARQARAIGYSHLRRQPAEPDSAEGIARHLNARTVHEDGFRFYDLPL